MSQEPDYHVLPPGTIKRPDYARSLPGRYWHGSRGDRKKTVEDMARHHRDHADPKKIAEEQLDTFLKNHPEALEDFPEKKAVETDPVQFR